MNDRQNEADNELYQQVVLDHNRNPRNWGVLVNPTHHAEGFNPLCGDKYNIGLNISHNGIVNELKFEGYGCAISKASASMMSSAIIGLRKEDIKTLFENFRNLVTGKSEVVFTESQLGKLRVFTGVSEYPARVKCAMLAWHTLLSALNGDEKASTE